MSVVGQVPNHRKRKRRRVDKTAISAHLLLTGTAEEDVGFLSEDLFTELFPGHNWREGDSERVDQDLIRYVAISPWTPSCFTSSASVSWTIIPVKCARTEPSNPHTNHSSLQLSLSSPALPSFFHQVHAISPSRSLARTNRPIEIRIHDVVPLGLHAIFLEVQGHTQPKPVDVSRVLEGGFRNKIPDGRVSEHRAKDEDVGNAEDGNGSRSLFQEDRWRDAVRMALKKPKVIRVGDLLQLSVSENPRIYNVPVQAKITLCEPVSQGLLLPKTQIIISQPGRYRTPSKPLLHPGFQTKRDGVAYDEDTPEFTPADMARWHALPPSTQTSDALGSEQPENGVSDSEDSDLSDDSAKIISLSGPVLPPHSSSILSSVASVTPRAGAKLVNGLGTPEPLYPGLTVPTVRAQRSEARVFRAQSLLEPIPDELLHPKPGSEEDEEARIFVDTGSLVRIQCFSGDWVKIRAATEARLHSSDFREMDGLTRDEEQSTQWRAVKIYALPHSSTKSMSKHSSIKMRDRHSSLSSEQSFSTLSKAHVSPILLVNMGGPAYISISSLSPASPSTLANSLVVKSSKFSNASMPPLAKGVTMLKLATPLSTERLLQPTLLAGLKEHFEHKKRVIKSGDIVAVAIDESLGKAVFQGSAPHEQEGSDELLISQLHLNTSAEDDVKHKAGRTAVAWFKVGNVVTAPPDESPHTENLDPWGGIAFVDSTSTRMTQAGIEQGRIPATTTSPWQYYLGTMKLAPGSTYPGSTQDTPKAFVSQIHRRIRELISAATSARAIHLGLPPLAILLTSTQRHVGKATTASKACLDLGIHTFRIDSYDILTEGGAGGDVKTEALLKARAERAMTCGAENTALLIKHIEALNADRMISALKEVLAESRVLIATTTEVDKVSEGIRGLFTHELEMTAPDEAEREGLLIDIINEAGIGLASDVSLRAVAIKTAALVAGDLRDVVDRAIVARQERLQRLAESASTTSSTSIDITTRDLQLAGGESVHNLTKADFDIAVDAARKNFADAIGAPKIPNVTWDDVGGLANVKDAVMETIQLPLERPELFAKGMKKRSGILFYGPPGTGKTLLAKAIATEFSLNFFSVKGPELLNMYIGESEANVRRVFQRARDARPCVVFFDELDSVAPKRGNQGDSGGVMDRIVSQLLAELDGMSSGEEGGPGGGGGVFVIGATNRPDLLDQALLRPGRFDKMLYLGVSDTHEKQKTILEALTRKFALDPSLSLSRIASTLPFTYTGADLYALCSDAMLKAITRCASAVDAKIKQLNAQRRSQSERMITTAYFFDHFATPQDVAVVVTEDDFMAAKAELVPSVSVKELQHYERVRRTFEQTDERNGVKDGGENGEGRRAIGINGSGWGEENAKGKERSGGVGTEEQWEGNWASLGRVVEDRGKPRAKGKGKGKENAVVSPYVDGSHSNDGEEENRVHDGISGAGEGDEDDFIIRTDHLSLNGGRSTGPNGFASGKRKWNAEDVDHSAGFQDPAARDEEELYS